MILMIELNATTKATLTKHAMNSVKECSDCRMTRMPEDTIENRKETPKHTHTLGHILPFTCLEAVLADDILLYVHIIAYHAGHHIIKHGDRRGHACRAAEVHSRHVQSRLQENK